MHRIVKDPQATSDFKRWTEVNRISDWNKDFVTNYHDRYLELRTDIAENEQKGLSAYTEAPLGITAQIHIDHFRKQSMYPALRFVRDNLFVDDRNDNYGACYKDNRAGVNMDTFDGPGRIFDPAVEDMASYIIFNYRGELLPRPDIMPEIAQRVDRTIKVFRLDHEALRAKRKEIITLCRTYKDGGLTIDETRECLSPMGFPTCLEWAISVTFTD